ncbi:MAG: SLC13 family permease [Bacteroidales bacterium]|nr:SLC13 family permease [Bacteroidales bacterium]MDD3665001.1 SLC13 family permease [Bacteroidales bacterium]
MFHFKNFSKAVFLLFLLLFVSSQAFASGTMPSPVGIRLEFILFALTLVGVALFHNKTMYVALTGLSLVLISKFVFVSDFSLMHHLIGGGGEEGEWRTLVNLIGLLFGFGILAKYFEESGVPDLLPKYLPDDWKGGLVLLALVMVLSSFLDNIAAAMIGGTIALVVYKGRVHIGFLAAIIAASNAGGAGSVVGDTTTTLMWIDGVSPLDVTHAFIASVGAFLVFGVFGAMQQHNYQPIQADPKPGLKIDSGKLIIVALILVFAILANAFLDFPAVGVWVAILIGNFFRKAQWSEIKHSWQGTVFLTSLVLTASLMPVDELPAASWQTAFSLGFVSAVFDNIPLTKLCLEQGGYDWGVLAYTVGFGGSMIWFGSSAGVALTNKFPEGRSVFQYVKHGWHVIVAYIVGFFIMLGLVGWHPHAPHKVSRQATTEQVH